MRQLKRRSWLPGAVLTWSLTRSKQWRWSPCSHHHEQHCDCSGVIQIPEHLISQDLKWHNQIESIVKKAQQRRYFFHQLRKFNLPQELLIQFYSAIIESVLCTSITVWFSSASNSDHRRLRRVVRTAEQIISTTLPTLQESAISPDSVQACGARVRRVHSLTTVNESIRRLLLKTDLNWMSLSWSCLSEHSRCSDMQLCEPLLMHNNILDFRMHLNCPSWKLMLHFLYRHAKVCQNWHILVGPTTCMQHYYIFIHKATSHWKFW